MASMATAVLQWPACVMRCFRQPAFASCAVEDEARLDAATRQAAMNLKVCQDPYLMAACLDDSGPGITLIIAREETRIVVAGPVS